MDDQAKKTKILVTQNGEKLIILHGKAQEELPILPRKNIAIFSTDIFGPAKFWNSKKQLYTSVNSHVLYDKTKGAVRLILMETDATLRDEVSGKLSSNPELEQMDINSEKTFTHSVMMKKLRWSRGMFPNRDEYEKIVANLTNFKAKVETAIEKNDDKKGNTLNHVATTTSHQIPLTFNLKTNLFIGQPEIQFDVTIIVSVQGQELCFGLESMTLYEQQNKTRNEIVDDVLNQIEGVCAIEATLS